MENCNVPGGTVNHGVGLGLQFKVQTFGALQLEYRLSVVLLLLCMAL